MKRKTRKEMILEIYDREAMGEVTAQEIGIISSRLIDEFGEGGAMTPAEIARVLVDEDIPVKFEQVFRMSTPNMKYESLFEGLAVNKTLAQAEDSITKIDEHFRQFSEEGDDTGIRYSRRTALRAKENALAMSQSKTMTGRQRLEQLEIANWFTIWLQTPEIFFNWLEIRKNAAEFRDNFQSDQAGNNE